MPDPKFDKLQNDWFEVDTEIAKLEGLEKKDSATTKRLIELRQRLKDIEGKSAPYLSFRTPKD